MNEISTTSPTINLTAAMDFVRLLTGTEDAQVTLLALDKDRGLPALSRYGTIKQLGSNLESWNTQGYGIFLTPNRCDGAKRTAADVVEVRAVFVDCDHPGSNPLELIDRSGFDFDFTVESSSGKFHAYRRVSGFPLDPQLFKGAQLLLADKVHGDLSICDLPRPMRIPGFIHRKADTAPFLTRVHEIRDRHRVTPWRELMREYGWTEETIRARAGKSRGTVKESPKQISTTTTGLAPFLLEASAMRDGDGRDAWMMKTLGYLASTGLGYDELHIAAEVLGNSMAEPFDREKARDKVERIWRKEQAKMPPFPRTELGFAQRFQHTHGNHYRYVPGQGWLTWEGNTWVWDVEALRVRCAVQKMISGLKEEAESEYDSDRRKEILSHYRRLSDGKERRIADAAQSLPGVSITPDELDTQNDILVVNNGSINLRTGRFEPPCPQLMTTKLAPVSYDANATCPKWEKFISEVMVQDAELIRYLQKIIGYSATGSVDEQAMFIFIGDGSNGKSLLLETISRVLGRAGVSRAAGYTQAMPVASLMRKHGTAGGSHSDDIAALRGARLVTTVEPAAGQVFDEALVKSLTGGDVIAASQKYKSQINFVPTHTIIMAANYLPRVQDTDNGIWRRLCPLPFDAKFKSDSEVARRMTEDFKQEACGILNWIVEGAKLWYREALAERPRRVEEMVNEYRQEMDTIGKFLNVACVTPQIFNKYPNTKLPWRVGASMLYAAYQKFCLDGGFHPMNLTRFGTEMKKRPGIASGKSGGNYYAGIMLRLDYVWNIQHYSHSRGGGKGPESLGVVDLKEHGIDIESLVTPG
ncbi:phage/plasmid primase, P4 family [Pseudoduganella danionis]|uniref:SF3 helicase domain-containing protein n=1 Tax=Pseudoduganella danionis TaxID=1890295 RepID=A0ABW9SVN4_9BURK|nr:phage/plasmid primase, P4 family [Pseudoduganella danionis]MTW34734.1 hypothetical protein [Pseudoduganella danionis]